MKKMMCALVAVMLVLSATAYATKTEQKPVEPASNNEEVTEMNAIGALTPEEALEYMMTTEDLVIVETREPQYIQGGFTGVIFIPHTEMAERYSEIPENRPVILHCGGGVVVREAYRILTEKRPDIPELSYIAGRPLFDDYNTWLEETK